MHFESIHFTHFSLLRIAEASALFDLAIYCRRRVRPLSSAVAALPEMDWVKSLFAVSLARRDRSPSLASNTIKMFKIGYCSHSEYLSEGDSSHWNVSEAIDGHFWQYDMHVRRWLMLFFYLDHHRWHSFFITSGLFAPVSSIVEGMLFGTFFSVEHPPMISSMKYGIDSETEVAEPRTAACWVHGDDYENETNGNGTNAYNTIEFMGWMNFTPWPLPFSFVSFNLCRICWWSRCASPSVFTISFVFA